MTKQTQTLRPAPYSLVPTALRTPEACREQGTSYRAEHSQPCFFQFTVLSFLFCSF